MKAKFVSLGKSGFNADSLKWIFVFAFLIVAVGANYYWHNLAGSWRFFVGVVLTSAAIAFAGWTKKGKMLWRFAKESRVEMRKIVWPNRKETVRITVMIVLVVILMAVILGCVDSVLIWFVSKLIGQ